MMKKYRIYTFIQGHSEKASNGRKQKQKPYVSKRWCTTRVRREMDVLINVKHDHKDRHVR